MKEKFYLTTAIDYVNAEPHIGHAYQKIVADVLARWNKLLGKDVFFLTGTDEHGKKVQEAAKKAGKKPEEFANEMSKKFKKAWQSLQISPDRFIRTTDKDHEKVVEEFIKQCNKSGDIYKGKYEGYYCTNCEAYYTERDAPNLTCPFHKKPLERLEEESYFFKLSKYQKFLLELYKKNPEFIFPKERKNEITKRVEEGLRDISISRTSFDWGIPFPLDKKHIVYVWFEALINYYTATREKGKEKYWPADLHVLGKDNAWFHCVYWPAMLKSAGIEIPKKIFNHGFLLFNSQKISKSLGNSISPQTLAEKYSPDTVRYFTLRQIPFATGEDGDFSEKALVERHNNELANKLGNLISRVSALAEKYGLEKSERDLSEKNLLRNLNPKKTDKIRNSRLSLIQHYMNKMELDKALNEIFSFIDLCNEFIQKKQPWKEENLEKKKILYNLANAIKDFTILLSPFIPETCEKISKVFNFKIQIEEINKPLKISEIKKSPLLFRKLEFKEKERKLEFNIGDKVKQIGVTAVSAVIYDVKVSNKNKKLEKVKKEIVEKINLQNAKKILDGYKKIYSALGTKQIPPSEKLISLIKKTGRLPNINTVVDSYNLTAVREGLSISAHDLDKIKGDIEIKKTKNEKFHPLGEGKEILLPENEFATFDRIKPICRMDIKQSEKTKITKQTKNIFIYIQGNKETSEEFLEEKIKETCELITKFSGGKYSILK